jgi:hypothetical protein
VEKAVAETFPPRQKPTPEVPATPGSDFFATFRPAIMDYIGGTDEDGCFRDPLAHYDFSEKERASIIAEAEKLFIAGSELRQNSRYSGYWSARYVEGLTFLQEWNDQGRSRELHYTAYDPNFGVAYLAPTNTGILLISVCQGFQAALSSIVSERAQNISK